MGRVGKSITRVVWISAWASNVWQSHHARNTFLHSVRVPPDRGRIEPCRLNLGCDATDAGVLKSSWPVNWPTYLPPLMDPKLRVTWTPSNGVSFSAVRLRNTFACSDFVQTGEHRK